MTFNIEVSVSGGATGHRVSLLKSTGEVQVFDSREAADVEADRYRRQMNGPHATATFSARVVPAANRFVGVCTCDHLPEQHAWGQCGDGCPCKAGWEE